MVDFYDNVQSFYEAPELELLSDPSSFSFGSGGSGYFDPGFGSSSPSFYTGPDDELSPYLGNPYTTSGSNMPADDPSLEQFGLAESGYDPQLEARGGSGFYEIQEDDRTIFKQLQEYLGLDDLLSEKDMKFLKAFASAAGLTDKYGRITGAGLGRTAYKPKTKAPSMKQGAALSAAKRTANNMARLSRTAPNGNQYLQRQNFNDFVNRVSTGDFGTTGSGPRGTNIKEASLKAIAARKYVPKA
jgi:hypothetical protein